MTYRPFASILWTLFALGGFALANSALLQAAPPAEMKPAVVKVVKTADGWQLQKDGQPFFVRGIGGTGSLELAAKCGANTVRTWGVEGLDKVLDEAHANGMFVAAGIWLGHERHGFDYANADQVADQMEKVREAVLKYKDHPALLMWGLGNEMEGYAAGDNAAIWGAINNLGAMVKRLDPNHPTMTVVAEIGGQRVKNFHRFCSDIDILGINSYAGGPTIPKRYREAGGTKPYLLTEFGPPGAWETTANAWGAKPELSSTAKAAKYRETYEKGVLAAPGVALGGFAFLWGTKQEASATWFGMLLPDGTRVAAADTMAVLWGKPPANRCPVIEKLAVSGADQVDPGATIEVTLTVSDPEKDPLKIDWILQAEPESFGTGGDAEAVPPTFPEGIVKSSATEAVVKLPQAGGYRLFAYIRDGQGGAAVANVPLLAKGVAPLVKPRDAKLPLVIYDEAAGMEKAPYIPAGWMGNAKALKLTPDFAESPHAGTTCIKVEFSANDGWGGVVWQSPAGDWGDRAGGWNWSGAKKLTFWARGAEGGETVSFEFGLLKADKRYHDSGRGKLDKVKLIDKWQEYVIDLSGQDLSRIKTGFCFVVANPGKPMVFFLDDIKVE